MKMKYIALAITSLAASFAKADTLVVMVDISGSTPALERSYMQAILPKISDQIQKLPLGSLIKVFSVGDDKAPVLSIDRFVQRRRDANGDIANKLASEIPNMLAVYLNKIAANRSLTQNESSLSPAFLDASKWCQHGACTIDFLTDGCENQPGIISWPEQYMKPLPDIPKLDLKGASVFMYGVGQGVSSVARIAIEQHWETFLTKHHAGNIQVKRL